MQQTDKSVHSGIEYLLFTVKTDYFSNTVTVGAPRIPISLS